MAARMAAAAIVSAGSLAAAVLLPSGPILPPIDRLVMALRADVFVVAWLALAIADVARRRFLSPDDIAGSAAAPPGPGLRAAAAFLQNTLEQVALAVPAHLALAAVLPRPSCALWVLAALFGSGRWLFRRSYTGGAAARAFGFALTFYPNCFALLAAAAAIVVQAAR